MSITIVGTPQVGSAANGADVTLTFSTTPSQNDVVIVFGGHSYGFGGAATAPGTGYTQIGLYSAANTLFFGAWYKRMGASPDSTVVCKGSGLSSDSVAYGCYVLRGVDTTTAMDAAGTTAGPSLSTNPDAASITTVTDNAWVIPVAGSKVNDAAITAPSGYSNHYTINQTDSSSMTVAGATLKKTTAGAENPASWTNWATGNWYAITIAVRPAAAAPSTTGAAFLLRMI